MAFYFNPRQHPLVPSYVSDGIPEISTDSSVSVVSDECSYTNSSDGGWVISLNNSALATPSPQYHHHIQPILSPAPPTPEDLSDYDLPTTPPLSFPHHNGSGSFIDRINEWRLDQSQLVLRELRRFEQVQAGQQQQQQRQTSSTPESVVASWSLGSEESLDHRYNKKISSIWNLFTQRVTEFIGINDQIQELMAGERYFGDDRSELKLAQQQHMHYHQALATAPGWESTLINKVFGELHIPRPFWRYLSMFLDSRDTTTGIVDASAGSRKYNPVHYQYSQRQA